MEIQAKAAHPVRLFNNQFHHHQQIGWKRQNKERDRGDEEA